MTDAVAAQHDTLFRNASVAYRMGAGTLCRLHHLHPEGTTCTAPPVARFTTAGWVPTANSNPALPAYHLESGWAPPPRRESTRGRSNA